MSQVLSIWMRSLPASAASVSCSTCMVFEKMASLPVPSHISHPSSPGPGDLSTHCIWRLRVGISISPLPGILQGSL